MTRRVPKSELRSPSRSTAAEAAFVMTGELVDQSTSQLDDSLTTRRGVVMRKRKGELDRITAYLPYELGAEVRMRCAARRIDLSEAIAEGIRMWMARESESR
jgi:hypothetical protein